jgi:hypothetical protein
MTSEIKTESFDLKGAIRTIPDYPKPGILFRDITTLLGDARAFRRAIDELVQPWSGAKIDKVAGMEARGFILGGAVAHQLSVRRASCRTPRSRSPIRWNMGWTRWRSIRTRSSPARRSFWSTISSPPAARRRAPSAF